MLLRFHSGDAFCLPLQTRMPFRYGIATVTRLPHAFVRVTVIIDGKPQTGIAADHLAPKWFTKDPQTSPEEDIVGMKRVIEHALASANGLEADSPWAFWRTLYQRQAEWGKAENLAPLLTHFGVSLVERAVLDAFCRAHHRPFHALLHDGSLGVHLAEIHPELAGLSPADLLPAVPLSRVRLRHTVGLSDPLTDAAIAETGRLHDGLPQSLEACIREYGLCHFKLKIGGDPAKDTERLGEILSVIAAAQAPNSEWAFSLDGNESYQSLNAFRTFWELARTSDRLRPHFDAGRLLFVEQPLHRSIALSDAIGEAFATWPDRPPVIIDESDATLESLPRALSLGYAGTSHKNCKGVFKGIANACLLAHRRRTSPEIPALLSGEDLSNVGPIALPQDLAVQATLGIDSVERNGQHYFRGLSAFPQTVQAAALAAHPDLYHEVSGDRGGFPSLSITDGFLHLDSVNAAPFGVGFDFNPAQFGAL